MLCDTSLQVEALLGYHVLDVACGSGDAQTLCITEDDSVWSWGDGDYGKLGRGGSDGCKVIFFKSIVTFDHIIAYEFVSYSKSKLIRQSTYKL